MVGDKINEQYILRVVSPTLSEARGAIVSAYPVSTVNSEYKRKHPASDLHRRLDHDTYETAHSLYDLLPPDPASLSAPPRQLLSH